MSRWDDLATWRGPTPNQGGPMVEVRGLVLHIAQGGYEGTVAWCRNPGAEVSAHFIAGRAGQRAQMVDTDVTAWTQRVGNGHWLSVECEGFTPDALTDAQLEFCAQLLARGHRVYGYPLQLATSPAGRGLGHHSMGAENGVDWGHSACPGPAITAQKPAILARAVQIIEEGDDSMPSVDDLLNADVDPGPNTYTVRGALKATLDRAGSVANTQLPALAERVSQLHAKQDQILAALAQILTALPEPGPAARAALADALEVAAVAVRDVRQP